MTTRFFIVVLRCCAVTMNMNEIVSVQCPFSIIRSTITWKWFCAFLQKAKCHPWKARSENKVHGQSSEAQKIIIRELIICTKYLLALICMRRALNHIWCFEGSNASWHMRRDAHCLKNTYPQSFYKKSLGISFWRDDEFCPRMITILLLEAVTNPAINILTKLVVNEHTWSSQQVAFWNRQQPHPPAANSQQVSP